MSSGGPTILLDVFLTNQRRKRMIAAALADTELPAEDYPVYVLVGAEGPWTPTGLATRLEMPLSTMLFRLGRLERRGSNKIGSLRAGLEELRQAVLAELEARR